MVTRRRIFAAAVAALTLLAGMSAGASTAAAAAPACIGAAARDLVHPCTNTTLSVVPTLARRERSRSSCRQTKGQPAPVCAFGAPAARAKSTIALIGDSHALHWRAALDVVARAKRWHGLSVTASTCTLTTASKFLPEGIRDYCIQWNREMRAWFSDHPEISTVFITQAVHTPLVVPAGKTVLATKVAGYRRAWSALPRTVKHVIVIRDSAATSDAAFGCVARVLAEGKEPPGPACRTDRSFALKRDPAASTVSRMRSKRIESIDLTKFFCDRRYCFPVIGGVLVHKDTHHLTRAYSHSLGPYVLREVRRLIASW